MTDTTSSPFILLRTATGLVSIDVRTIAGAVARCSFRSVGHPVPGYPVTFDATIGAETQLLFATAEEADDAVAVLHAARELHDDARAEDARAKVVGEAIRESGREFTQQIADTFRQVAEGVQAMLDATLAATEASRKLGTPPRSAHEWGWLDAEAIIEYDLGREHPASEAIHACIRQIADKPHRTPLYLADLVRTSAQPRIITDALGVVEELRAGAMLRALDVHPSTLALLRSKGYVDTRVDEHGRFVVNLLQSDTVVEFVDWRDLPGVVWSGLRYAVRAFDGTLPSDVHIAHDLVFFGLVRQRGDKHELTPLGFLICESGKEV